MKSIINLVLAVLFAAYGVFILATPYEKYKEKFPKAPAEKNVKILGIILIILGIAMGILAVM